MGKGKFSWPSGATYEGEFDSGFLDGFGTFIGASGDSYRGVYSMNLKNGNGRRIYTNGDVYDGEWKLGVQDGHGKYIWKNGHEYIGEWKGGVMGGKGILVWANGNRYDGYWEDGVPNGKGKLRWSDGSHYVGMWSKDPSVRKGIFSPSASSASPGNLPRDPQDALAVDLDQCRICSGENLSILPSKKMANFFSSSDGNSNEDQNQTAEFLIGTSPKFNRKFSVDSRLYGRRERDDEGSSSDKSGFWEKADRGEIIHENLDGEEEEEEEEVEVEEEEEEEEDEGDDKNSELRMSDASSEFKANRSSVSRLVAKDSKKQGVTIAKGHKNYELMLNLQLGIRHQT